MLVTGYETPVTQGDQDTTWQLNITATTVTPGDPEVGVLFTAPPSGRVLIIHGGGGRNNSSNDRVLLYPELYEGTKASEDNLVQDADWQDFAIPGEANESIYGSRAQVFSGLTLYAQHYARLVYAVTGGSSGDLFVREICVVPLP